MKSIVAIAVGITVVGVILFSAFASAGYLTAISSSTPNNRGGMMGGNQGGQYGSSQCGGQNGYQGGMMGGMMGGSQYDSGQCPYGSQYHQQYCLNDSYQTSSEYTCPHMDGDEHSGNYTAMPCQR